MGTVIATSTKSRRLGSRFRISVLDRYIARELVMPFLFGVGAFTSVGIAIGSVFELVSLVAESGLSLWVAARIFVLRMPQFLAYSFPMATLLSALITYSRMASDSEVVALRSAGISIYRLVAPALAFSLAVTGATFVFNEFVVPAANYEASIALERALGREKPPFRQENILYTEYDDVRDPGGHKRDVLVRLFYAEQFDGDLMHDLVVIDRSHEGINQIVDATSATWNPQKNSWDFYDGTLYAVNSDASLRNVVRFDHQTLNLPRQPFDLAERGRDYGEMNILQSREYLNTIREGGSERRVRKLRVRIQQKIAFPFICLVFGVVGAALGTNPHRTGRATGFGISIIVIFTYYLTSFVTGAMGQLGILTPLSSAWIPNVLGLGIGGWLLLRASR
ncbi:putative permease [Rubidibacter lacunae KORDI 51-2]|uniref:Putative permease n=1 Tax=Rubidibacter lacunae KORDI 51-2 TaxID=582515 RepID=U5DPH9_9CHRO|nr:LptF/LptG family permease [Rubidibacter lacunae]ERN42509.1 putative permease [Rubidibacter lacunae KORDI 51-2]